MSLTQLQGKHYSNTPQNHIQINEHTVYVQRSYVYDRSVKIDDHTAECCALLKCTKISSNTSETGRLASTSRTLPCPRKISINGLVDCSYVLILFVIVSILSRFFPLSLPRSNNLNKRTIKQTSRCPHIVRIVTSQSLHHSDNPRTK